MDEENLFPEDIDEDDIDEEEVEEAEEAVDYIGGVAFINDLARDGQNKVRDASGIDSWKQWCINCLMTERYTSPIYSTDFGIAITDIFNASTRAEAEAIFRAEAEEALEADPYERTDYVGMITFEWGVDAVGIVVEVVGVDGATIDFEINLESG